MAKIPHSQSQFGNRELHSSGVNLPNSMLSGAGTGLNSLGASLARVGEVLNGVQKEQDQLALQQALLDIQSESDRLLDDPSEGFQALKGENAFEQTDSYLQKYTEKVQEVKGKLKDNSFIDKFNLQAQSIGQGMTRQMLLHELGQRSAVAKQTIEAGNTNSIEKAATLFSDDTVLNIGFTNQADRVLTFLESQGAPKEVQQTAITNFKQQYFSSSLDGWIANTELNGGDFVSLGEQMKDSFAFNQLSEINQAKYLLQLDRLGKQQANQYKDSLNLDLTNAHAMQVRGIEAPNIPLARFNQVYGDKGQLAYDAFQGGQVLARNISAMQNLPSSELIKFKGENIKNADEAQDGTDGLAAQVGADNFAGRLDLQDTRIKAANKLLADREKDPIGAAYTAGEVQQIDYADLEGSLTNRIVQATRISNDYQTPLKVFSNNEAEHLSKIIQDASATQQTELLSLFATVGGGNDDAYNSILETVGLSSPAFASAGRILHNPNNENLVTTKKHWITADDTADRQTVATTILTGLEALKGTGKGDGSVSGVASKPKVLAEFEALTSGMFTGDATARQNAYSTAIAYYTGRAVQTGNYGAIAELDDDLMEEAVNSTMGGKSSTYNVRKPWGMSDTVFNEQVSYHYQQAAKENGWGTSDNYDLYGYDPQDPFGVARKSIETRFQLVPDTYSSGQPTGKYLFKAGNGFLSDKEGNPVIIDLLSKNAMDIPL